MVSNWKKDIVYLQLKRKILSGELPNGTKLAKELDFSRELHVAKVTLRSALARLESEGLVERLPSKGTFVRAPQEVGSILVLHRNRGAIQYPWHYIVPGITAAAAEAGYPTTFCFMEYLRNLGVEKALEHLREMDLSGVLLVDSTYRGHEPEIDIFHKLGKPVLLVHPRMNDHETTGFSSLVTDTRAAWRAGLKHLADSGRTDVRILELGEFSRRWESAEYPALFRELGLRTDGQLSYFLEDYYFSRESVESALDRLLGDHPETQAVYCYSDFVAITVMETLAKRGIRVPDDVAVMGYCGYPGNTMLETPLSTVDLGYMDIGRMAVDLLPRCPEGTAVRHLSPFRVIGRTSTEKGRQTQIFALHDTKQPYRRIEL